MGVNQDGSEIPAERLKAVGEVIRRHVVPLNNSAVMPDGSVLSRGEILAKLNLNPNTPPDAWLAVVACGSNASALNFDDAEKLVEKGLINAQALEGIRGLQNG